MKEALESRTGLPDALRVLLEDYPRGGWESHDNFGPLIRFWLDRHLMFRRLLETMNGELERALDGKQEPRMLGMRLARYGTLFVGELHGHHTMEDTHYFPHLQKLDPRLEHGFEILDCDHKDLDTHLDTFTRDANEMLKAIGKNEDWRASGDAMRHGVSRMEGFLDRHLTDEEELVVPILLKFAPEGMT